jgi:hypothetical protein
MQAPTSQFHSTGNTNMMDVQSHEVGEWSCITLPFHKILYKNWSSYLQKHDIMWYHDHLYKKQLKNGLTDFSEILYGHYATGDYPKWVLLNFIQTIKLTSWMLNIMRWEDHPLPWCHYPWSSIMNDDATFCAAIFQWLGYQTQCFELLCCMVTSEESLFFWRKWIMEF